MKSGMYELMRPCNWCSVRKETSINGFVYIYDASCKRIDIAML